MFSSFFSVCSFPSIFNLIVLNSSSFTVVDIGKHPVDLTVRYGGTFVHVPIAKYIGGDSILFKGVAGGLVGDEYIRGMCSNFEIHNIKAFYILEGNGFRLVRAQEQFMSLFSKAIIYSGGRLTLYADVVVVDNSLDGSDDNNSLVDVDVDVDDDNSPEEDPLSQVLDKELTQPSLNDVEVTDWVSDEENVHDVQVDCEEGCENADIDWEQVDFEAIDAEIERKRHEKKGKGKEAEHTSKKRKGRKEKDGDSETDFFEEEYDNMEELLEFRNDQQGDEVTSDEDEDYLASEQSDQSVGSDEESGDELVDEEFTGEAPITEDNPNWSSSESEKDMTFEGKKRRVGRVKCDVFAEEDMFDPKFAVGTVFTNKTLFRTAVHSHANETLRKLKIHPNDKLRMHAKCDGGTGKRCKWIIHTLRNEGDDSFRVHHYYPIHKCNPTPLISNVKSRWLAKKFLTKFSCDPTRKVSGIRKEIIQELGVQVTNQQVYRAKKFAFDMLYGTEKEQIGLVWDYQAELLDKNPGSTILVDVDEDNKFHSFYCCLAAVKEGFKSCRKLVGVDGCHLNGV